MSQPFIVDRITRYEKVRIIATRAEMLARGAVPLIDLPSNVEISSIEIARKEFDQGVLPMQIERTLPDGSKQFIDVSR